MARTAWEKKKASTTDGPQLAGNQTYRVFIRLIDPNHSLNLARAPPCFSGLTLSRLFSTRCTVVQCTQHLDQSAGSSSHFTTLLDGLRDAVLSSFR